jgi:hypothetical protein
LDTARRTRRVGRMEQDGTIICLLGATSRQNHSSYLTSYERCVHKIDTVLTEARDLASSHILIIVVMATLVFSSSLLRLSPSELTFHYPYQRLYKHMPPSTLYTYPRNTTTTATKAATPQSHYMHLTLPHHSKNPPPPQKCHQPHPIQATHASSPTAPTQPPTK